mmetsp:Transcript_1429/g.3284  ORF Transcript_1429/g.3284 Transcript_1429/m.3284 type:complete len:170 (-) Transcript_1429:620-1129(-)
MPHSRKRNRSQTHHFALFPVLAYITSIFYRQRVHGESLTLPHYSQGPSKRVIHQNESSITRGVHQQLRSTHSQKDTDRVAKRTTQYGGYHKGTEIHIGCSPQQIVSGRKRKEGRESQAYQCQKDGSFVGSTFFPKQALRFKFLKCNLSLLPEVVEHLLNLFGVGNLAGG